MNPFKSPSLGQMIVFTASRLESLSNTCIFQPLGLTLISVKIMHIIHHKNGAAPSDLLKIIGGTKSNITQRLNYLEKNGLVERSAVAEGKDRRTIMVRLTKLGKEKLESAIKIVKAKSVDLEKCFSEKEIACVMKVLSRVNLLLDEHGIKHCVRH
jgi:DNA-binding MarR family transcriptional regulator